MKSERERVRDFLQENKMKASELAKECDVTKQMINCIIAGTRTPSRKLALAIQDATNNDVSARRLLDL